MRKIGVARGFGMIDIDGANCLNACDTPNFAVSGSYPSGSIYYMTGLPLPAPWNTCRFLFIQP